MSIWCVYSGGDNTLGTVAGAVPTAGEWGTAATSLNSLAILQAIAAGDTIVFAHDHNATVASPAALTLPETGTGHVYLISVDRTNTTTLTPLSGAIELYTTAVHQLNGFIKAWGLTLKSSFNSSSNPIGIGFGSVSSNIIFEDCTIELTGTTTSNVIRLGSNTNNTLCKIKFIRTNFKGAAAGQSILLNDAYIEFENCSNSGGTTFTTLITTTTNMRGLRIDGGDYSANTNLLTITNHRTANIFISNIKPPTNITTGTGALGRGIIELHNCGTGDHNYYYQLPDSAGTIVEDTGVYLTSGGYSPPDVDGSSIPQSLKFVSGSSCSKAIPLVGPWIYIPNTTAGSRTVAMKVAHTTGAALKDIDIAIEVEFFNSATLCTMTIEGSYPLITGSTAFDCTSAGSNLTDTAEAWTGITSEITHTLSKSVSIQQQGYIRARAILFKASTTVYLNPVIALS